MSHRPVYSRPHGSPETLPDRRKRACSPCPRPATVSRMVCPRSLQFECWASAWASDRAVRSHGGVHSPSGGHGTGMKRMNWRRLSAASGSR
jgi:hypothetical protein